MILPIGQTGPVADSCLRPNVSRPGPIMTSEGMRNGRTLSSLQRSAVRYAPSDARRGQQSDYSRPGRTSACRARASCEGRLLRDTRVPGRRDRRCRGLRRAGAPCLRSDPDISPRLDPASRGRQRKHVLTGSRTFRAHSRSAAVLRAALPATTDIVKACEHPDARRD